MYLSCMATTTHKEQAMIPNYIIHSLEFNQKMLNMVLSYDDNRFMPGDRDKFIAKYRENIAFAQKEIDRIQRVYG